MRLGSIFSGVGGLDLGLERIFAAAVPWFVEADDAAAEEFAEHHPDARRYPDVRTAAALPPVDIIAGGFPCQDLSHAGRKAGLAHGKNSGLAVEFLRIIGETKPAGVVLENTYHRWRAWVPELRRRLWALGYSSVPVRLSAAEVGAPHLRYRAFVLGWRAAPDPDGASLREWAERHSRRLPEEISRRWEAEPEHAGSARGAAFSPYWPAPPGLPALDDEPTAEEAEIGQRLAGNAVVPRVAELAGLILANLAGGT